MVLLECTPDKDADEVNELVAEGMDSWVPSELEGKGGAAAAGVTCALGAGAEYAPDTYELGLGGRPLFCADKNACALELFTPAFSSSACKLGNCGCADGIVVGRGGREDKSGGGPGSIFTGVCKRINTGLDVRQQHGLCL